MGKERKRDMDGILPSPKMSQFNSDTEKFVPDGVPVMLTDEHKQK
jgi:hypothetical protein